jgi:hypothetical protein
LISSTRALRMRWWSSAKAIVVIEFLGLREV